MITIAISDPFLEKITPALIERAAHAALEHEQADPENDLTVAVEDDARLQELNREFLGIDAPTDVLSFPSGGDEIDPETNHPYLGDIILSYPRALEQAAASGDPVEAEIQLLVVHGVLHLLGYDHAEPAEKAEMWAAQAEILQMLAIHLNRLPE